MYVLRTEVSNIHISTFQFLSSSLSNENKINCTCSRVKNLSLNTKVYPQGYYIQSINITDFAVFHKAVFIFIL
jgi:hypothetical protein